MKTIKLKYVFSLSSILFVILSVFSMYAMATPTAIAGSSGSNSGGGVITAVQTPAPTINMESQVHNAHIGPSTIGLQCDTCHGFPPKIPTIDKNGTGPGHYSVCENCHAAPPDSLKPSFGNLIVIHLSRTKYCTNCHDTDTIIPAHPSVKAENGTIQVVKCENCHANPQNSISHVNGGKYCLNADCHGGTMGSIDIDSTPPGARIYLNGSYKGTTPKILTKIPQGPHEIKLIFTGYNDWSYTTLVSAGDSTKLSAQLTSITPTFTPLPAPTSTKTPEMLYPLNWTLIGGAIMVALISLYLIIGALRKHKSKASVIRATDKPKPVAAPSEETDRKSQTVLIDKSKEPLVKKTKEAVPISVTSAYEYKGAKIYYKIKIENNAIEPLGDIKIHLFVPEVFLLAEKEKAISMLETQESKTVSFEIRPTGECGECNISGKIEYYDYATKGRKMLDIENKSLSVICPVLKRKEIDLHQWEKVTDELIKAEENIKELSAPAENLFNITSRAIKDNGMFMLKPEITSTPQLFNGIAMFYAEGVTGYRYAAYMEVVGGARNSRMILKVWAEKDEALIGFYHRILNDIEKRIDVKIFIDDTIVQQHIHFGDNISTQVKDSFVQRSTVGGGARKCPSCGREVEANEKFCNECGAKL